MIAHVLLNLLNKLRKSDKMRSLPSFLSIFRNEFHKFTNPEAQILDFIYHMMLRLFRNHIFGVKTSRFCHIDTILSWASFHNITKLCKPLVVHRF